MGPGILNVIEMLGQTIAEQQRVIEQLRAQLLVFQQVKTSNAGLPDASGEEDVVDRTTAGS